MPEPKTEDKATEKADSKDSAAANESANEQSASIAKVKEEKDTDNSKVDDSKKAENEADSKKGPVPIGAVGAAAAGAAAGTDKPATAVFVGGINERAPNSMMRELLSVCGFVNSWKRVTGADGKLQSFGFCEFADPVATMICDRLLGQIDVAGKKLLVRIDASSQGMLDEYKKRHGLPDAPAAEKDEEIKRRLTQIVQRFVPEIERVEDGELDFRAPKLVGPKESLDDMDIDVDKRNIINREIEFFRSRYRDDSPKLEEKLERERERERERRRREKREKERERDRDKEREERREQQGSTSKSRSSAGGGGGGGSSAPAEKSAVETDEEAAERRRMEKMMNKEQSYQQELKHWTQREKKKARDAERERERELRRRDKEAHEAREMRNFLAEYDDELDDAKFYRGDAFRRRLRERDREREQDERDRARERDEVDEARRRLLAEGREQADVEAICAELDEARDAHLRRYLTSSTPANATSSSNQPAPSDEDKKPKIVDAVDSAEVKSTIAGSVSAAPASAVFANEEEKKALIKRLIDGIPTAKDELFAYNLDWSIVDSTLMQNRVKPWINKKIIEYLGEEEAQLTEFVCAKVIDKTKPEDILNEIMLVLDDEAEVFVVKLWRLLIYETEAKKAGLVK
uniref:PWI domain-containing protein n=1 Tax=Macrostomum lignano TaxID=282301 RepID=A0A1I8J4N1_9PLAT